MITPIGRELLEAKVFSVGDLKNEKPELGQAIVTKCGKRYTFHIFTTERFDQDTNFKDFELTIDTLKQAMQNLGARTFSIAKHGKGLTTIIIYYIIIYYIFIYLHYLKLTSEKATIK